MKNAWPWVAIISVLVVGFYFLSRESIPVPTDEPYAERVLTVSPGRIVEKDRFGNLQINPEANFSATLFFSDYENGLSSEYVVSGAPLALSRGQVDHDGEEVIQNLIGITTESFIDTYEYSLEEGRNISDSDSENVVVVGQSVKKELQDKGVEEVLGENLLVRGTNYEIVGILNDIDTGSSTADADWNKLLLIPFHQSEPITVTDPFVEEIRFIANASSIVDKAASDVDRLMSSNRGDNDFTVLTPGDVQALNALLGI